MSERDTSGRRLTKNCFSPSPFGPNTLVCQTVSTEENAALWYLAMVVMMLVGGCSRPGRLSETKEIKNTRSSGVGGAGAIDCMATASHAHRNATQQPTGTRRTVG